MLSGDYHNDDCLDILKMISSDSMKTETTGSMADVIRMKFRALGWSMKKLSEQSGVPYAGVHGLITGNRDPQLSTAERLCKVLGLELGPTKRTKSK